MSSNIIIATDDEIVEDTFKTGIDMAEFVNKTQVQFSDVKALTEEFEACKKYYASKKSIQYWQEIGRRSIKEFDQCICAGLGHFNDQSVASKNSKDVRIISKPMLQLVWLDKFLQHFKPLKSSGHVYFQEPYLTEVEKEFLDGLGSKFGGGSGTSLVDNAE